MAKKQKSKGQSRADAVRAAVDQAFHATAGGAATTRERAQELADELAHAASRVREALDELRPPTADELRALGRRIDALEKRLKALEGSGPAAPAKRASAKRAPAKRTSAAASGSARSRAKPPSSG
jgi:polyhydroxyalkanoate synthesis regulator phasin